MPLRITKASDPIEVKTIVTCVIGDPGLGKTTLGFTAEDPLLLDFDRGVYRAKGRGDTVQVETWEDVVSIKQSDLVGYKTLLVDTAGRALDCLSADIIDRDPKMGRGGALSLPGYGALKTQFTAWLKLMKSFGLDVVLIAHLVEEKQGDDTKVRLDAQGASKGEIYKSADLMGRLYLDRGKRTLNFNPTDVAFGKNPGQLDPVVVPDVASPEFRGLLGGLISKTKASLNRLSAEAQAQQALLTTWNERISAAESCSDFDALVAKATEEKAPKEIAKLVGAAALAKGFKWDKARKAYDLAPAPEKAA